MKLESKIPAGPLAEKWDRRRQELKLVNPANKRKYHIIVVGTGLAGASAAATLGVLVGGTVLRHRAVLMRQKTIPLTETAYSAFFMTP
jgi:hypothetical protein